jgi:sulfofructose kinase
MTDMGRLVICLGCTCADNVFELDEIPLTPIKVAALRRAKRGGGPAATGAVACAKLNIGAELWSWLGRDAEGEFLRASLQRHGVDVTNTPLRDGADTIVAFVLVDRRGERMIVSHGNFPMQHRIGHLPLERVAKADAVLVDSSWQTGAVAVLEAARAAGVPAVFDAENRDAGTLMDLARRASVPVFSEEGFERVSGGAAPDSASCAALADRLGASMVGVTLGSRGSLWRLDGGLAHVPALPVVVQDTTGAGDVFHGALAAALAERMELLEAARFASVAASLKCALGNGWDGMPDRAAVEQAIRRLA